MYTKETYPLILDSKLIAEIMGISRPWAYEVMERSDFPLRRIGRRKLVARDDFFEWFDKQTSQHPLERLVNTVS